MMMSHGAASSALHRFRGVYALVFETITDLL